MKGILKNWNIVRVLRLVIGIGAIGQSVVLNEVLLGVVGAGLLLLNVLNVGCCGVSGCSIETVKEKKDIVDIKPVGYEEMGTEK